jgi:hypothetical protein
MVNQERSGLVFPCFGKRRGGALTASTHANKWCKGVDAGSGSCCPKANRIFIRGIFIVYYFIDGIGKPGMPG